MDGMTYRDVEDPLHFLETTAADWYSAVSRCRAAAAQDPDATPVIRAHPDTVDVVRQRTAEAGPVWSGVQHAVSWESGASLPIHVDEAVPFGWLQPALARPVRDGAAG